MTHAAAELSHLSQQLQQSCVQTKERSCLACPTVCTVVLRLSWRCRYPCVYCGPNTRYDFQRVEEDNEDEAYNIMDNLKAAVANK